MGNVSALYMVRISGRTGLCNGTGLNKKKGLDCLNWCRCDSMFLVADTEHFIDIACVGSCTCIFTEMVDLSKERKGTNVAGGGGYICRNCWTQ